MRKLCLFLMACLPLLSLAQPSVTEMNEEERNPKMESVGKLISWTEEVPFDICGKGLVGLWGSAIGLSKVIYTVQYTGVVEKVLGGESVKCIVKTAEILDPRFASVNYLKGRRAVNHKIQEHIGETRVLTFSEFRLL